MAQTRFRELRWESFDEMRPIERGDGGGDRQVGGTWPPAGAEEHPLVKLLRRTNVPRRPDPAASVLEEAEFLLQAASEIGTDYIPSITGRF